MTVKRQTAPFGIDTYKLSNNYDKLCLYGQIIQDVSRCDCVLRNRRLFTLGQLMLEEL